jgi:deazaflavin-dependent oxidoreductase (nitroreductase family)
LIYGLDGDRYVVVASTGGAAENPAWYLNLVADPEVELQVGAATFRARAHTAGRDEKPPLWELMASIWPDYDKYQAKTEREIPVITLDRI